MLNRVTRCAFSFLKSEDGPTAVEYAVMLALIVTVCFAAISTIGNNVDETMEAATAGLRSSGS
jgi:pilus assembly protein Flp/PilA